MPRELKEIRNFNEGILLNASERDIPDNAASYSLNINPLSEAGILSAINNDKLFFTSNNKVTTVLNPMTWGSTWIPPSTGAMPNASDDGKVFFVNNVEVFDEKPNHTISYTGTKGFMESLVISEIKPYQERLKATSSLNASWTMSLSTDATTLSYNDNSTAIALSTAISGFVVTSGFTDGVAVLTQTGHDETQHDGKTMTVTTADGKAVVYEFDNNSGGPASGALIGSNTCIQIYNAASAEAIIDQIELAIGNATYGHGTRISLSQSTGVLTLTDDSQVRNTIISKNDYITLIATGGSFGVATNEIIKIESIDNLTNQFTIKRGCFGTPIKTLAAGDYDIYSNRITIDGTQITSVRGCFKIDNNISDASGWAGNHIGGNSSFLNYSENTAQSRGEDGGTFACDASNKTITFNADAKTIVFGTDFDAFPGEEGDTLTVYSDAAGKSNYGYSGKIIKKTFSNGGTLTMDTAPVDEAVVGNTLYFEFNLIKNHTFHHKVSTSYQTVADDAQEYRINDWKHRAYYANNPQLSNLWGYAASFVDDTLITSENSGGYWDTSPDMLYTNAVADKSAFFYPHDASDRYIKIQQDFLRIGALLVLANDVTASDNYIILNANVNQFISKNDILKIGDDANCVKEVEYMKVTSVEGTKVSVERGFYGTLPRAWSSSDADHEQDVYKSVNHAIHQSIPKDRLKPGQEYTLSFYAQDNDGQISTGSNCSWDAGGTTVTHTAITHNPIKPGMKVTGTGVATGTLIVSVTDSTHFVVDTALTGDVTGRALGFSDNGSARGGLSLTVNGGYINFEGRWIDPPVSYTSGHGATARDMMIEDRWIPFEDLNKPNDDIAVDVDGNITESALDGVWRRFEITFTLPEKLITNLDIEFGSRGKDATYIYLDLVDLRENTKLIVNDNSSLVSIAGVLDNAGKKDLVFWDSIQNKLSVVKNVFEDSYSMPLVADQISTSGFTSSDLTSSSQTITPNNREVHIGLGSRSDDSYPQWLGYVNHKVFGKDYSNELYQDEDTIHKYGAESAGSLSKICVAGEHEYLAATWDTDHLDITHADHRMNVGDNIVIREWADTSNTWSGAGVWVVISSGTTSSNIACKRYTSLDANPSNTDFLQADGDRDGNTGYICYRPYYYYGIRDGDYSIYRITPSDRINNTAAGLDTANYPAGKVERSMPLRAPLSSICTCHAKNPGSDTSALTGGCVYVMSNVSNDIYKVDVQEIYNAWETTKLGDAIIRPEYRSFKWSNDNTNGNIGGDTEVYGGLAEVSSPIIEPSGIMSDIIETKGPTASFVHDATAIDGSADATTGNTPNDFDTRLWIQFRPGGEDTFGEGARYLFCGKTETTNTDGEDTIAFADRTPPMNVLFGRWINYNNSQAFACGNTAGHAWQAGQAHNDFPPGKDINEYTHFNTWIYAHNHGSQATQYLGIRTQKNAYGSYYDYAANGSNSFPYLNFGWNIGWQGHGAKFPAVKVAKYGLCPMADNDKDGIIDGTGVIVPSTKSIQTGNPFGNLHQRISSHAVGLIGGSERPWWAHGGKILADSNWSFWTGGRTWGGLGPTQALPEAEEPFADSPWDKVVEKCLFVCTDMHYGDNHPTHNVDNNYLEYNNVTDENGIQVWGSTGAQSLCMFTNRTGSDGTWSSASLLQAGDIVFVDLIASGVGNTFDVSGVVTKVDGENITLDIRDADDTGSAGTERGTLWLLTNKPGNYTTSYNYNHGMPHRNHSMYHYAYDADDPGNGEIFTKGDACGHYGRKWFTPPTMLGGRFTYMPGIRYPLERLNWRSGFLIRPFDTNDNTFEDLVIGNLTAIDIPASPDVVYHTKNSTKLHYHVNNTSTANNFATRMYISSDATLSGETDKTKMYICDLNLNYPDVGSYSAGIDGWNSALDGDHYNTMDAWDIYVAGTLGASPYITENADNDYQCNAEHFPLVKIVGGTTNITRGDWAFKNRAGGSPSGKRNGFHGMCITVVDQNDGTCQTRYVVGSEKAGDSDTDDLYLKIHWPFGRAPQSGDSFYLSHQGNLCTAPIRLFKEVELPHNLGTALKQDPTLDGPMYKGTGASITDGIDGDGTTVTVTTAEKHNLASNDTIEITDTTNYNGIYTITVIEPIKFTFTQSDSTNHAAETGTWTVLRNTESSSSNPLKLGLSDPNLKTFFGGLDMRKLKTVVGNNSDGDNTTDVLRVTTATVHNLSVGDSVTFEGHRAEHRGTYIVKAVSDTTNFDVYNTDGTDESDSTQNVYTNQWETVVTERGSTAKIGEIRSGFAQWDRGNIAGNPLRYDTDDDASSFYNITSSGVEIKAASVGGVSGDVFLANTRYEYKISLIYDGYQEGPLSSSSWNFEDTVSRGNISITVKLQDYSRRLTGVCVYRRDTSSDFYKLVDEIPTDSGWTFDGTAYSRNIEDGGPVGASYSARTGMSEVLDTIKLKYGISATVDGYLFAGDCAHSKIENAANMIFRSRPGMFSIFDYVNDFLTIEAKPTAMVNFNGRLYVFDSSNIYRVNPHTLQIEDVYEGIGCLNKDCVIVTEYGMFFADKNGVYQHNGTTPQKISIPITLGGDTLVSFGGTDNFRDLSWDSIISRKKDSHISISFLPRMNALLINIEYLNIIEGKSDGSLDITQNELYTWVYSISQNRWDLWEISKDSKVGKPFLGEDGKMFLPIGEAVYEFLGGTSKRAYTWISKKLSMDQDSTIKVYNKVKVNGLSDNLNLDGSYKESNQRLIVHTSAGEVATGNITYSSESSDHSTYKMSGSNRKGRWLQFKLEDMTKEVDSLGLVFRRRKVK